MLPPLVKSNAAPSGSLINEAAVLRRPATAADRIDLQSLDRFPNDVLAIYARYVRVIVGPRAVRIAIVPARVCTTPVSGSNLVYPPAQTPRDVLLMQVLSNPRSFRPTVYIGSASEITGGQAIASLANARPRQTTLQVTVVPDGVARVVFRYPGHRPSAATAVVHDNVGIANPTPQYQPTSIIWDSAPGTVIRRLNRMP
jgi:hypothetical protein